MYIISISWYVDGDNGDGDDDEDPNSWMVSFLWKIGWSNGVAYWIGNLQVAVLLVVVMVTWRFWDEDVLKWWRMKIEDGSAEKISGRETGVRPISTRGRIKAGVWFTKVNLGLLLVDVCNNFEKQKKTIRFNDDGRNPSESTMVWIVHCFRQHSFVGNVGCAMFYCRSHWKNEADHDLSC